MCFLLIIFIVHNIIIIIIIKNECFLNLFSLKISSGITVNFL